MTHRELATEGYINGLDQMMSKCFKSHFLYPVSCTCHASCRPRAQPQSRREGGGAWKGLAWGGHRVTGAKADGMYKARGIRLSEGRLCLGFVKGSSDLKNLSHVIQLPESAATASFFWQGRYCCQPVVCLKIGRPRTQMLSKTCKETARTFSVILIGHTRKCYW